MNATPGCSSTMPIGYVSEPNFKGPYVAAEIIIALLAIVGNVLVCLAVSQNHKLRTVANYFLVSLSVADILVGLLAIPCAVLTDLGLPRHDIPLCLLLLSVLMVLTQSSILSLLAVAAERYVAILLPFQYQRIMSPRNARLALLLTWSLAVVIGSVPLMDWHRQARDADYCVFTCVVDMEYMVYFNFFGCLLVPLAVMFAMYGHIFLTIRRQLRRIGGGSTLMRRSTVVAELAGRRSRRDATDGQSRGVEAAGNEAEESEDAGELARGSMKVATGNEGVEASEASVVVEGGEEKNNSFGDGDRMVWSTGKRGAAGGDATGLAVRERDLNGTRIRTRIEPGRSHGTGLASESSNLRRFIERARKNADALGSKKGKPATEPGSSTASGLTAAVFVIGVRIKPPTPPRSRQEFRKAKSLFLVLFLFMLCWLPIHIVNCVLFLCPRCPVPVPLTLTAILLSHANSALNPLLYAYRMRSFRRALGGMWAWRSKLQ